MSNSIQQLQQETEAWQPQGQRQALVLEPPHGETRVCQDTKQQELEPAEVLAMTEALKRDLDFCRDINRKQLAELQQQECAVEQEHQDLVLLMQQFQALKDKISDASLQLKDQAVQTEFISNAAQSHSDTSHDIPVESRQQLEQLGTQEQSQGLQHSPAQLQEQSGATQAQKQQSLQQLGRAKETIQGLHQEVEELQQQVRKTAVCETQRQQLHPKLRRMQSFQEQSKQEERLQELSRQAQHWQQLHVNSERALALREDELVVCKVELAFLKEELSKVLHDNNLTAPPLHNSAEPPLPNTHLWDKKQCKIKQGLD
ncbi:polyamine modulated factor 1 binding protein 1 [Willisornis vidua]|uniref:Polyamine modulated factor 1 binding protein 1 n=1 Tax=Willisornis vidua TaxID=1566151 RepID=A0ABQ9D689_9PASS|nr:polyamine modulated factor 1 binding protein 1 [Willisornis vidua]